MEQNVVVTIVKDRPVSVSIAKGMDIRVTILGQIGKTISSPPAGYFQVTNLYVNAEGKLVVLYDDNPAT
jgi:hypothetical protein